MLSGIIDSTPDLAFAWSFLVSAPGLFLILILILLVALTWLLVQSAHWTDEPLRQRGEMHCVGPNMIGTARGLELSFPYSIPCCPSCTPPTVSM